MYSFAKTNLLATILILSVVSLSMTNLYLTWVVMEITTLSFLFFMSLDKSSKTLCGLKYFIIQAVASVIIVITFSMMVSAELKTVGTYLIGAQLAWKMGMAPFQLWFMSIIMELSWMSFFVMSTLMKIIPLYIMSMMFSYFSVFVSLVSILVSPLAGISQMCIKKIMGLSSVFTSGWVVISMMTSFSYWLLIMAVYSTMLYSFCVMMLNYSSVDLDLGMSGASSSDSMAMFLALLSLSGIPPFSGFFIKLYVVLSLMKSGFVAVTLFLVMISCLSVYMYMKLIFKYMTMVTINSSSTPSAPLTSFYKSLLGLFSGSLLLFNYM